MENINLIRKIAWNFAKKTGLDYDELFQEAAYRYCLALESWDEDKKEDCKFSSFAYRRMYFRLVNFCKEEARRTNQTVSIDQGLSNNSWGDGEEQESNDHLLQEFGLVAGEELTFEELIAEWPEDCRKVAEMILDTPGKFVAKTPNFRIKYVGPKRRQKRVKKALEKRNWDSSRIQAAMETLPTLL